MIYLDYAACNPMSDKVKGAIMASFANPANHQSSHDLGTQANVCIEELKDLIAVYYKELDPKLTNKNVVLTGSGSDANLKAMQCSRLTNTKRSRGLAPFYRHDSFTVPYMQELSRVAFSLGDFHYTPKARTDIPASLDNYTFVHTPVTNLNGYLTEDIASKLKKTNWIHVDDVQGYMKPINTGNTYNITTYDSIAISAHKIGGPPGIGAIIFKDISYAEICKSLLQKGTMNIGLVLGWIQAIVEQAEWLTAEKSNELFKLYEEFYLKIYKTEVTHKTFRVITNRHVPGTGNIVLVAADRPKKDVDPNINYLRKYLNDKKIYVSESSACTKTTNPDVLKYLGIRFLDETPMEDLVRISFGRTTDMSDIDALCKALSTYKNYGNKRK